MRYLLLGLFLFSFNIILAQDWKEMMDDPSYNIYEVVEVAETYFENIDKNKKGSGWKKFQRWLFENEPKFYPQGTYLVKAHRIFEVLNLIKKENEPTLYTNKREVVDTLKDLVLLGENIDYQKQHIKNIKNITGEERIFK